MYYLWSGTTCIGRAKSSRASRARREAKARAELTGERVEARTDAPASRLVVVDVIEARTVALEVAMDEEIARMGPGVARLGVHPDDFARLAEAFPSRRRRDDEIEWGEILVVISRVLPRGMAAAYSAQTKFLGTFSVPRG